MKQNKLSITAVLVCSLASLFYLYDFFLRVMPSAMTNELMVHFHIGAAKLGIMLATFYYAYAPMQIPAGLLFDKLGTRLLMTIMVVICAFSTLMFGITDSTIIAAVSRFMIGLSSAFAFLGALVFATRWLPHKYFALYVGLVQLLGCAGAIIGEKPIALAVRHFGWRNTNLVAALLGFALAILFWIVLRDYPEGAKINYGEKNDIKILKRLRVIYKNPQNWWIGLYAVVIWAPASIFAALWGVPFLMTLYKINASLATGIISLVWIGIGIGCPVIGWWSDHIRRRCLPLVFSAFLGIIVISIVLYCGKLPFFTVYLLLFLLGISISGMVITFGVIKDVNSSSYVGVANGFNNMATLMGGIIFQPMVGIILHVLWRGEVVSNIPTYNLHSYKVALSILPICFFLALIIATFFIKETYCRPYNYGPK